MANILIDINNNGSKIASELHSHFIEFLGTCIYDGIWVGKDSAIPNYNGMRKDVVDAMKELEPPLIRWPGGCYADVYHWRNGIGESDKRPVTYNENFGTFELDSNQFGTHEFMAFCKMVGAKPWININMMSGSIAEMREWMEYCNRAEPTELARERGRNGAPEPFHIEYWGLGNEVWGGGGMMTARQYAMQYRTYATAVPRFSKPWDQVGMKMKLIACGPDGNKPEERVRWTKDFFEELKEYRMPVIDGYDLHFYNWNLESGEISETDFDQTAWDKVIRGCLELEGVIKEQYYLINETQCSLILGEWGNWHQAAFENRPALYQQCTMRDAITTALTLDILHRNCEKVKIACVAQSVNVLNSLFLTQGEKCIMTPNYDVFKMYMVHRGANCLEAKQKDTEDADLYIFASIKDNQIAVNLVNASYSEDKDINLEFSKTVKPLGGWTLAAQKPDDFNSFEEPEKIRARSSKVMMSKENACQISVSAASVNVYLFELK